jgi:hypothetical protein
MLYNPGTAFVLKLTDDSQFGPRTNPKTRKPEFHGGIDFAAPAGTTIPAASEGLIVYSGANLTYGNAVIIQSLVRIKGVSFAFNFPKLCHVAHALN